VSTQDFSTVNVVRASLIPTTDYVAGAIIDGPTGVGAHLYNQLVILVNFTKGSLDSAQIKVEFSNDKTTWYQETFEAVNKSTATASLGEHSFDATGNYRLLINIKDKYIKISAKGTGTTTNSLIAISANYGVI